VEKEKGFERDFFEAGGAEKEAKAHWRGVWRFRKYECPIDLRARKGSVGTERFKKTSNGGG